MTYDNFSHERLSAAKLWLITASTGNGSQQKFGGTPYLAAAVFGITAFETTRVKTIAGDEGWRIYVNRVWLEESPIPAIALQLAHVVWHLLFDHAGRARSMQVSLTTSGNWQRAADICVAEAIDQSGHSLGLPSAEDLGFKSGLSVEEYFAPLSRISQRFNTSAEIFTHCECGSVVDGIARSYEVLPVNGLLASVYGDRIRKQVAIQFGEHVKLLGTTPGDWERWLEDILEPKAPWPRILAGLVRSAVGWMQGSSDFTYSRPSRRQSASPLVILPAMRRPRPSIAIVVDTSGSVDDGLLAQAMGEVDGVLRSLGVSGEQITVIACDAAVQAVSAVRSARDVELAGGGGTDMVVGILSATLLRPRPEVIIVMTDGYTPWPDRPLRGVALIAAIISRSGDEVPETPRWVSRVDCSV